MAHRPFIQERSTHRPARFAQRVKEELATMIPGDLKDPRLSGLGFLTITTVTITPDLKHCTINFALMGKDDSVEDIEDGLNAAATHLRKELMHRLATKVTPHLIFKHDNGFTSSMEINALLSQIIPPNPENAVETVPEAAKSESKTESRESPSFHESPSSNDENE